MKKKRVAFYEADPKVTKGLFMYELPEDSERLILAVAEAVGMYVIKTGNLTCGEIDCGEGYLFLKPHTKQPQQSDYDKKKTTTFCPECGWNIPVDDDGCCVCCGATATGKAVNNLVHSLENREGDYDKWVDEMPKFTDYDTWLNYENAKRRWLRRMPK